jgi:prepilin-type N-terminal cleavage/methylation domain-containing protein
MKKNLKKGFTIIELLVVVAIIAVLTGIVLVNVAPYLNKGKDAAIKANLSTLLTNGAIFLDSNGNYNNFCANNMVAGKPIYDAINSAAGAGPTCNVKNTNDAWCACSSLRTTAGDVFCVDSTGYKKETTNICANACPAAGACV